MINKQDVLNLIKDMKSRISNDLYSEADETVLDILLNKIAGMEEVVDTNAGSKWIPCSERLSERNKVVLCWVESTTIASGETYIIGSCDNGFWFLQVHDIGTHSFPVKDYKVIAWMPLPEPYREVQNDKP